jgi:hypothetical protein
MNLKLLPVLHRRAKKKENLLDEFRQATVLNRLPAFLLVKLFEKYDSEGPHCFLVDKLFGLEAEAFFYYAHQYVYLMLKRPSSSIRKLLCFKCSESWGTFLLIFWSVNAFGHPIKQRGAEE